ncbi:MAG TPA: class I SAM-dependent methyltransferase [Pyrinomonadaceae bacterium]|jgi:ubiquinone/menaquinone biosynthesis C-methylase UbiE
MKQALYDSIGVDYNRTRTADPFLAGRLVSLMSPRENSRILDIGCGTGNYTVALVEHGYSFCGVEPSETMIEQARRKSDSIVWTQAAAEELPFEKEFFGAAMATLTIHHWKNLEKGFAEIHRVLKKESNFVIFTSYPEQTGNYWLKHYFPVMLKDSMAVLPEREKLLTALESAGFIVAAEEKYFVRPDLQDLFLYSGKQRPELYLNAQVRNGISSFSALSNKHEVETGLQKLSDDLKNGNFAEIARKYESDSGDYCFIVATKLS